MTIVFDYITDADTIYKKSFACVRADVDLDVFPPQMHAVVLRMVHACANPDIVTNIRYTDDVVKSVRTALKNGATILCDSQMVVSGINRRMIHTDKNPLICTLNDVKTPTLAKQNSTTRSAGAVQLWRPYIKDSVVVIGNAPTALFYLLERILNEGWDKPACIIGLPIGYVGADDSKRALVTYARDIPYITLLGKMGGSAMACAVVNAILGCNEAIYNDIT